MAKVPGYRIVLKFATKTLVGYRSTSMDAEADMGNATTGNSTNQWKEYVPLFKGMRFGVEGLYDPTTGTTTISFDDVYDYLAAGTKFTAIFGGTETGDTYWSVDSYITRVHIEGPYDDLSSYSIEAIATGEPTTGTVS